MSIIRMADIDLSGKRVLIREDLNVPVADGVVTVDRYGLATVKKFKVGKKGLGNRLVLKVAE